MAFEKDLAPVRPDEIPSEVLDPLGRIPGEHGEVPDVMKRVWLFVYLRAFTPKDRNRMCRVECPGPSGVSGTVHSLRTVLAVQDVPFVRP